MFSVQEQVRKRLEVKPLQFVCVSMDEDKFKNSLMPY